MLMLGIRTTTHIDSRAPGDGTEYLCYHGFSVICVLLGLTQCQTGRIIHGLGEDNTFISLLGLRHQPSRRDQSVIIDAPDAHKGEFIPGFLKQLNETIRGCSSNLDRLTLPQVVC